VSFRLFLFFLMGCNATTIKSDDTALFSEAEADTALFSEVEADTDADTDADVSGSWLGVMVGVNNAVDDDFCEGSLSVEVSADGMVEGAGDCLIVAGPGEGQGVAMAVAASVSEGTLDGSVVIDVVAEDSVALEGSIGDGTMLLAWAFELPAQNNSPGGTVEVTAALSLEE
jgi:hypothetical protein